MPRYAPRPARRTPRLVPAVSLLVLLGACADPSTLPGSGPGSSSPAPSGSDLSVAARLVGSWTVQDSTSSHDGAVLQFNGTYGTVWRECGTADYAVIVGPSGSVRAHLQGGAGECDLDEGVPWLAAAARVVPEADSMLVEDAAGTRLATLRPGGEPMKHDDIDPSLAADPELTDELEAMLSARVMDLPDGLRPATISQVTAGRWYPDRHAPSAPEGSWLELDADGTWSGSDGCNGQGSVWLLEASGWFRTGSWAQTAIGCSGIDVGGALSEGVALAVDEEGALVALDETGTPAARFVRDLADSVPDATLEL